MDFSEFGSGGIKELWFRTTQSTAVSGLLTGRGCLLPERQKLGGNEAHGEKLLEAAHQVGEPTCLVGGIILILLFKKIAGEKFAKICIKCDFLHAKGAARTEYICFHRASPLGSGSEQQGLSPSP